MDTYHYKLQDGSIGSNSMNILPTGAVIATNQEIIDFNAKELLQVKIAKVQQLCIDYDNNATVKLQWTWQGKTDFGILRDANGQTSNRTYASTRMSNFKVQIENSAAMVNDLTIIDSMTSCLGRPPVENDMFLIPFWKYSDGRIIHIKIHQNQSADFLILVNQFIGDIADKYFSTVSNPYRPYNYYVNNQRILVEAIYKLNTIEEVNAFQYTFEDLVCLVPEYIIEDIIYAS